MRVNEKMNAFDVSPIRCAPVCVRVRPTLISICVLVFSGIYRIFTQSNQCDTQSLYAILYPYRRFVHNDKSVDTFVKQKRIRHSVTVFRRSHTKDNIHIQIHTVRTYTKTQSDNILYVQICLLKANLAIQLSLTAWDNVRFG